MLRSRTMHTIHELALQGKSIAAIARDIGVSRATVRKYRNGAPARCPYPVRATQLDTSPESRSSMGVEPVSTLIPAFGRK